MNALVLAGGDLPLPHIWPEFLTPGALVVAADGGLRHARVLGLTPGLIVGDLDSVEPRDLERHTGVEVERHAVAKDELDLELAIQAALSRGATTIGVVGAFGGRLDQSFAALLIAARQARGGVTIVLYGGSHEAVAVPAGDRLERELPQGTVVSLLALSDGCRVTTTGVAYPLTDASLPFGVGLGLSNAAVGGPLTLSVHAGMAALLVEHLPPEPRAAIWGAQAERIGEALAAADADLGALVERVAYGEVFAREGLDLRTRELLAVVLLTAEGGTSDLHTHLRGAMRTGASERELREAIIHAAMFVGFPRALAAMRVLQRFLAGS